MQTPRLEQWLTPTAHGVAACLVVDRARNVPHGVVAGRLLDHPALPFVLVAAFAEGEGARPLTGVHALVVRLDTAATGLVDGGEPTIGLARLAEFIEVALSIAEAAGLHVARVSVVAGGLSFTLVDESVDGDVVLLWRAALLMLADARGFNVDAIELDEGESGRRVVDGAALSMRA